MIFNYVNTESIPCDDFCISKVTKSFPIFHYVPPTYSEINEKLIPLFQQYKEENPESIRTNVVTTWRSGWFVQNDPRFKFFVDWIITQCKYICINHLYKHFEFFCLNMWLMQYEGGDHAQPHDHFPNSFSCVYYIDVEEGCSPIIFEGELEINPKPGMVVIFPSILMHEVPKTDKKRMVISMNFSVEESKPSV